MKNLDEVTAYMKDIANYHNELTTDEAFKFASSLCDLLHEYSAKKNGKSIQNNGVVNIPSDCTKILFSNLNSQANHAISKDDKLYIYQDPENKGTFIIVAEKKPIFKVGNKKFCPMALNKEFFSFGFQNYNLNPLLRRLKVKKKTIENLNRFGIDFSSKAHFENCWRFDVRSNQTIPAIKVVFN